jgi:type I restriction enzyme R subunit
MTLNEAIVEEAALSWFQELGYAVLPGPQLAPGEPTAERESFSDVLLIGRLRQAIPVGKRAPLRARPKICAR